MAVVLDLGDREVPEPAAMTHRDPEAGRSMDDARTAEMRIHGVGGSPGPRLLGYADDEHTAVVDRSDGVVVLRRCDESEGRVEGFEWGDLTSGSRLQTLWVFLLPYTLLNAAGWGQADIGETERHRPTSIRNAFLIVLGWLLTLSTAFWITDLLVNYAGYQWLVKAAGNTERIVSIFGWWHLTLTPTAIRAIGVGVGAALSIGLLVVVGIVAGRARSRSDEPQGRGKEAFSPRDQVFDDRFFAERPSWAASLPVHLVVGALAVAVSLAQAIVALTIDDAPRLTTTIDVSVVLVVAMQIVLLLVFLVVTAVVALKPGRRGAWTPWGATAAAFLLVDAF